MSPAFAIGAIAFFIITALLAIREWSRRRNLPLVVSDIYIHPVKSCRGIRLPKSEWNRLGFKYDRQWMVINDQGKMLTAREYPRMVLITPKIDEVNGTLTLEYGFDIDWKNAKNATSSDDLNFGVLTVPIQPPKTLQKVTNWDDEYEAYRYGEDATDWLTSVLGPHGTDDQGHPNGERKIYHLVSVLSVQQHERPLSEKHDWNDKSKRLQTGFSDGYPFLLASKSSLAQLNSWTEPTRTVEMRTFRPNIVVSGGANHLKAWDEDLWREIQIGTNPENKFWVSKPCERCIFTTIDPATGTRHESGEPLITMRQKRKMLAHIPDLKDCVYFGQNLIHQIPSGQIQVGDPVTILSKKPAAFEFAPKFVQAQKATPEGKKTLEQFGQ